MNSKTLTNKKPKKLNYTIGEEIANAITHGIGVALSIAALVLLAIKANKRPDISTVSFVIFGVSLIVLYLSSTLYHALPAAAKGVFGILDHSSIFILIAGTYTPYSLSVLRGALGWTIFGVVWGLAIIGIVLYAVFQHKVRRITTIMYIVMGWLIIFATKEIKVLLQATSFRLLLAGGIVYTIGCIFYAMKKIKWMHSIWHLFVLAGSILHFFSLYFY
ncbi:MAG: hemolysin III family protein [Treponemataceae bacterium]